MIENRFVIDEISELLMNLLFIESPMITYKSLTIVCDLVISVLNHYLPTLAFKWMIVGYLLL